MILHILPDLRTSSALTQFTGHAVVNLTDLQITYYLIRNEMSLYFVKYSKVTMFKAKWQPYIITCTTFLHELFMWKSTIFRSIICHQSSSGNLLKKTRVQTRFPRLRSFHAGHEKLHTVIVRKVQHNTNPNSATIVSFRLEYWYCQPSTLLWI
jgi:hypothetical protein